MGLDCHFLLVQRWKLIVMKQQETNSAAIVDRGEESRKYACADLQLAMLDFF